MLDATKMIGIYLKKKKMLTTVFQMDPCLLLSSGVSRTYELVTNVLPEKSHWLDGLLPTPNIQHSVQLDDKYVQHTCL